jgi:D-arginine utilization repressor
MPFKQTKAKPSSSSRPETAAAKGIDMKTAARSKTRKKRSPKGGFSAAAKLALLRDLVPKIARAIAPVCEAVLHENTSQPPTIGAIGNGHITGRVVGDLMTQVFIDGEDMRDRSTPLFNYRSILPDGRRIRVSLIPIIHDDKVIAYLGINFLTHDLEIAQQALSVLIQTEPHPESIEEKFLWPHDIIQKSIDEYLQISGRPIAMLGKRERVELIRRLRDRGVFGMRGATDEVASILGVSRTAIYNYLNSAKSEPNPSAARKPSSRG